MITKSTYHQDSSDSLIAADVFDHRFITACLKFEVPRQRPIFVEARILNVKNLEMIREHLKTNA